MDMPGKAHNIAEERARDSNGMLDELCTPITTPAKARRYYAGVPFQPPERDAGAAKRGEQIASSCRPHPPSLACTQLFFNTLSPQQNDLPNPAYWLV